MTWLILVSLLMIGLILVLVEIWFVPGTTLVGLFGILVSGIGIFFAFSVLDNQYAWILLAITILVNFAALIYGFRSGVWDKFALTQSVTSRTFDGRLDGLTEGQVGVAVSDLKPYGKAEFGEKMYEVKSGSGIIPVGTEIKISKLEVNRIIVKS